MKKRYISLLVAITFLLACYPSALASTVSSHHSNDPSVAAALDQLFENHNVYYATDRAAMETDTVYYKEYPSVEAFQADIEAIESALASKGKMPLPVMNDTTVEFSSLDSARANRAYLSLNLQTYYGGLYTLKGQWEYNWEFVNGKKEVTEFTNADVWVDGLNLFLTNELKVWLGYPISDFWYEGDQPYYSIADSSTDYYVQWGCDLTIMGKIPQVDLPIGYSWYEWGYNYGPIPEY